MKLSMTVLLAIISVSGLLLILFFRSERIDDLRQHGVLVNVKVIEVLLPPKAGVAVNFRCGFTYNGEQKKLISSSNVKEHASRYVGELCPALYSPKKNNLRVLLRPEDFEEYNVPLTDSLIEVINRINN